jgi:uncharacterized membrane protein YphA (DoxX/SURF4 family)
MKVLAVVRVLLGVVFIYVSYDKLLHPHHFAQAVGNYRLLPPLYAMLAAHALPAMELACGLLLVMGLAVPGASLLVSSLIVAFMVAISQAIWRGLDIDCGCFSAAAERVGLPVLLRDAALLAMSLFVLIASLRRTSDRVRRIVLL